MTETLQLVQHHQIAEFEAKGWSVADDMQDCHHGVHAVLMKSPDNFENTDLDGAHK